MKGSNDKSATDTEIKALRSELENVKVKMTELQTDYTDLQREYEKLSGKQRRVSSLVSRWRKMKSSFHVKVDGDEAQYDAQQVSPTTSRIGCKASSRRRLSVS